MRIAYDLDGTVFKTYETLDVFYQLEFGKPLPLDKIADFDSLTEKDLNWIRIVLREENLYLLARPYPDAIRVLDWLNKHAELLILTSRPKSLFRITTQQLDKYDLHGNLIMCSREDKAKFCLAYKVNFVIEDEGKVALDIAQNKIGVILLTRPWNKGIVGDNIIRVDNWLRVKEIFKSLKRGE